MKGSLTYTSNNESFIAAVVAMQCSNSVIMIIWELGNLEDRKNLRAGCVTGNNFFRP